MWDKRPGADQIIGPISRTPHQHRAETLDLSPTLTIVKPVLRNSNRYTHFLPISVLKTVLTISEILLPATITTVRRPSQDHLRARSGILTTCRVVWPSQCRFLSS